MSNIIEDNEENQFANGQSSRDLRVSSGSVLDVPPTASAEAHLVEAIDNIGDFFHFVEWSNKSEISSRGITHAGVVKPRRADPPSDCERANNGRLPWRRGLTLIFGIARKAEAGCDFNASDRN
jgi:hypothetical protein